MRLYVDLDETLIANVINDEGDVVNIIPRPGVQWFLRMLALHGDLWLLTAANELHARRALYLLGPESKLFKGMITREMMKPVEEQIVMIRNAEGLTDEQRQDLLLLIKPIAKPGVMFDDFPVGSDVWAMKSRTIGIDESKWIQVEPFYYLEPERQGLKKAYSEFVARFGQRGGSLGRRKPKMVKVWH